MFSEAVASNKYFIIYLLLAALRIILTCVPQVGYFHPDEFFQSFEALAGKAFEIEVDLPWEFNSTFPIRSMFASYVTVGLGFKLLKTINYFTELLFTTSILSPYFILVMPRLVMCLLSFINDFCLYKICTTNNEKYKSRLIILGTSFIMLTYSTRTFSNTIELLLFSLLLYFVAESMIFSNIVVKQSDYLNMRHSKAKSPAEKAKFHKLRLYLPGHSFRNCFVVATITAVGFFNRPTFVAFAAGPVFFWLYRGIGSRSVISLHFNIRVFLFALCTVPMVIFIVIVDSFYFGYISWGEIGMLDVSINSFVVTPFNFIKYNIDTKNLAKHGLHPRYFHILLNVPLLFGVLGFLTFYEFLISLKRIYKSRIHELPQIKTIRALMMISTLIALAVLSIFPHQEPRFLIPLIIPLVYLHGPKLLNEPEYTVVERREKNKLNKPPSPKKKSYTLLKIWIFTNLACTLFFGFFHQGGVVQVPIYFHEVLKKRHPMTDYHLVTTYVYSMPYCLFLQRSYQVYTDLEKKSYKRVHLHELGSATFHSITKKLISIHNDCLRNHKNNSRSCKLYLVLPTAFEIYMRQTVNNYANSEILSIKEFYPHFSTEALQYMDMYCLEWLPWQNCEKKIKLSTYAYLMNILDFLSLSLYEISFAPKEDSKIAQ